MPKAQPSSRDLKGLAVENKELERILKHDFSKGTETFRENLLRRCVEAILSRGGSASASADAATPEAGGDPAAG